MMNTYVKRFLPWMWYPLLISASVLLHLVLSGVGVPLIYSTYIPVVLAAVSVTLLEIYFPYRKHWKPNRSEVINDTGFMVVVQILLPQLLSYFVAMTLIAISSRESSLWPADLSMGVQVLLMILLADFFRYWLHRASHEVMPLWQLHAVHHSPRKLYWLNVGRFHPLDKALQFLFDALPFIVLGVDQTVLSLYFVVYAVNGYFQHSNIHVRFGWLNYIISSAEVHRWHHSDIIKESNGNYGNNIIIWDILFGTYFFPKDRGVDDLGLQNKQYPTTFVRQLKSPFIPRLEKQSLPLISYKEIFINICLKLRLKIIGVTHWSRLMRSTHSPMQAQNKLLMEILNNNKESKFGIKHNFKDIKSPQEYAEQCKIQSYDDLKDYMDDPSGSGLTEKRASFYQVTSGTTGSSKYLPMTEEGLHNDKVLQNMVALSRYLDNPSTYMGKIFVVVSPAIEGHMESGVPFGSASGLTYMNMPYMARSKYVVPYDVFEIEDYDTKYLFIALFALAESQVSIAATANPSTFIRLLEVINDHATKLVDCIATGTIDLPGVEPEVLARINKSFRSDRIRAEHLNDVLSKHGELGYQDIWPHLQQLVTWTGGSCGIALSSLKKKLPLTTDVTELGYLASEVRASLTIDHNLGLLTFTNTFYEFIERDTWEDDQETILLLDQLEEGKQYYVIITTVNGLYRYFMNDIIEVTGFYNQCPTIQFLQKGKGATNITGEKLYESQVLQAIKGLENEADVSVVFQQWIADEEKNQYFVYVESKEAKVSNSTQYSETLDTLLSELNIEYHQKRMSGRLKPVQFNLLRHGTGEAFKNYNLAKGQREGQYKAISLVYRKDCDFPFDQHVHDEDQP